MRNPILLTLFPRCGNPKKKLKKYLFRIRNFRCEIFGLLLKGWYSMQAIIYFIFNLHFPNPTQGEKNIKELLLGRRKGRIKCYYLVYYMMEQSFFFFFLSGVIATPVTSRMASSITFRKPVPSFAEHSYRQVTRDDERFCVVQYCGSIFNRKITFKQCNPTTG